MTKPKTRNKQYNPNKPKPPKGACFRETTFLFSEEDAFNLQVQTYHRLACLVSPAGAYADRTTLMIRMYAALELMKSFYSERAQEVLEAALEILDNCRDKENRCIKQFDDREYTLLAMALSISHELFDGSTLWEQALAVKVGEDKCILHADEYDYILAAYID